MGRKTPGLNTSSMSDISFLLLAFFLMVSNINSDSGIARRLPPPLPPNQDKPEVRERNIFVVKINSLDRLLFNGEYGRIEDLKDRAKEFLGNPNNAANLPEKEKMDIPLLGEIPLVQSIAESGDAGKPVSLWSDQPTPESDAFMALAENTIREIDQYIN